jgi:molybdenum cofactor cytidylyltransferase
MRIAALILAAGRSRRFGEANKLLAVLGGEPVVRRTVAAVRGAGLRDIVAVTGPNGDTIESVLADYDVRCVRCEDDRDGLGDSIGTGARALDSGNDGVMIVPGDMPLLSAGSLRLLVSVFAAQGGRRIVYAADVTGAQRNPVIWPPSLLPQLSALQGQDGAKALIRDGVAVRFPERDMLDVDTATDFAKAQQAVGEKSTDS